MPTTPDPNDGDRATPPSCPHCGTVLEPTPKRRRLCPVCREQIVPRTVDGRRVLLTEEQASTLDAERGRTDEGSSLIGCAVAPFVALGAVGAGIGWFLTVAFDITPPWWVIVVAFAGASVAAGVVVLGFALRSAGDGTDANDRETDRTWGRIVIATIVTGAAMFMVMTALVDRLVG